MGSEYVPGEREYGVRSASSMSKMIRAKKKKAQEGQDAQDDSSVGPDLQDLDNRTRASSTEDLDHNTPKEHDDGFTKTYEAERMEQTEKPNEQHMDDRPTNDDPGIKESMLKRKGRVRKMMSGR